MKKYYVVWNEVYCCSKTVEANSAQEAIDKCYDIDDPDQKVFGSFEDWSAEEIEDDD